MAELHNLSCHSQLQREQHDKSIWSFHDSGGFSTKSFTEFALMLQADDNKPLRYAAKVWCKMAPRKVELLVWFLVLGKLNNKDWLVKMNIIPVGDVNCILCNRHEESIEHLFSSCDYSWKL